MMKILVLLLFVSCASTRQSDPPLFPFGVYQHRVRLELKENAFEFDGANKWSREELSLVALGPLDVTILKYTENLKSGKKEVFVNPLFLPLDEDKAIFYLSFLRKLYELDRSICQGQNCQARFYGQVVNFELDASQQVKHIRTERSTTKIHIEVLGYEAIR